MCDRLAAREVGGHIAAAAVNTSYRIGIGAALADVGVEIARARDGSHRRPAAPAVLVEHLVAVDALHRRPADAHAVRLVREGEYGVICRAVLIGVLPARVVVTADKASACVDAAHSVGIRAAVAHVGVDVARARDVVHALPARGAFIEHAVAVCACDGVPLDLHALRGALKARD